MWRAVQEQGKEQPYHLVQTGTFSVREDSGREKWLLPSQHQSSLNHPWCEDTVCRDCRRGGGQENQKIESSPTFKLSSERKERDISYRPWGMQSLLSPRSHRRLLGWDPLEDCDGSVYNTFTFWSWSITAINSKFHPPKSYLLLVCVLTKCGTWVSKNTEWFWWGRWK